MKHTKVIWEQLIEVFKQFNASKMDFTTESSRSNKPTIGIVGSNQQDVAILNNEITLHVAIGINSTSVDDIKSSAQLCYDFGCDFIICTDNATDEEIKTNFDGIDIPVYSMDMEDMHSFIPYIVSEVYNCSDDEVVNRRPATEYTNDLETTAAVIQDGIERNQRFAVTKQEDGDYSILRTIDHKYCGIMGGAGPLASATFAVKCCKLSVPFVLYSNTDAPSRGDFENKVVSSYIYIV